MTTIKSIHEIKKESIIIDGRTDKLLRVKQTFYNVYARPRMVVHDRMSGKIETIDFEPQRFYLIWEETS